MCRVGVSDEARCSFTTIGLSNDDKWVCNQECTMPWRHAVVHFEVKLGCFKAVFHDDCPECGSTSAKQVGFLPRSFPTRYTRLGRDDTVAQYRHPNTLKRPGSGCASPQTSFVPLRAVSPVLWPI